MPTRFSVVRYVPDVIADERVNIGVVAVDDATGIARCLFVRDWSRASKIGNGDASFLRQVAVAFEVACGQSEEESETPIELEAGGLDVIARDWDNAIQVSTPKPIMMDPQAAVDFVARRYLALRRRQMPSIGRTKKQAVAKARAALETALHEVDLEEHRVVLHKQAAIKGAKSLQYFDYGIKNGVMRLGGFGLSFETGSDDALAMRINAVCFTAIDIKQASPDIPIAVVAIGDEKKRPEAWKRLDQSLGDLNVDLLRENQVKEWSEDRVAELVANH